MSSSRHLTRPVTESDAEVVARLLTHLGHPTDAADVPSRLGEIVAEGGGAFLHVDQSDRALGFFSVAKHSVLHASGPIGLITSLVVAEDARRMGVGRAMVAAAQEWAREAGCVRLVVTSGEHRPDAHAFYPACGMPYTGRRFSISFLPPH
jgi:GNAT superfamily N-acetyltransferase